jgi:hypothetical protein
MRFPTEISSFSCPWIRIRIPNTDPDPDPQSHWIRIRIRIHNPENKHMWRHLRPSVWTATTLKIISDRPFKSYYLFKIHIHSLHRNLSFAPHCRRRWQAADHCNKPVADRRSLEKTGFYVFTCLSCGGSYQRRKTGGLTVPVAAARQIL